jgi:hypothetical protein
MGGALMFLLFCETLGLCEPGANVVHVPEHNRHLLFLVRPTLLTDFSALTDADGYLT